MKHFVIALFTILLIVTSSGIYGHFVRDTFNRLDAALQALEPVEKTSDSESRLAEIQALWDHKHFLIAMGLPHNDIKSFTDALSELEFAIYHYDTDICSNAILRARAAISHLKEHETLSLDSFF